VGNEAQSNMQWGVVLLILFAAVLHAGWNVLIKSESNNSANTALLVAGSAIIGVVFLPFVPLPLRPCWPYLGASVVIHILYFTLLMLAYKKGDMSLVYPLMRGLPPVLTAVAAFILLNETLSWRGWLGIGMVSGGALLLSADYRFSRGFQLAPIAFALLNAIVIVVYTLVDAQGARLSGNAFSYTGWMLFLLALFFFILIPAIEGHKVLYAMVRDWKKSIIGGACTFASYGIALWAMTVAPVALVAALRETAILFGMILSVFILKERITWIRGLSIIFIVAGAVAIKMS
jgi:drug/metabolite transporter (DMT)-like permease